MLVFETIRGIVIIGLIASLVALGTFVVIRSGVSSLATPQGLRQAGSNLSHAALMLGACAFGIVLIHQVVGLPLGGHW